MNKGIGDVTENNGSNMGYDAEAIMKLISHVFSNLNVEHDVQVSSTDPT